MVMTVGAINTKDVNNLYKGAEKTGPILSGSLFSPKARKLLFNGMMLFLQEICVFSERGVHPEQHTQGVSMQKSQYWNRVAALYE